MINFKNDYSDIAHPDILDELYYYKDQHNLGYGLDYHSQRASKQIQKLTNTTNEIFFIVGGTLTNKVIISHLLKPYEAVISSSIGHIHVHETGAIEALGLKIIAIDSPDGKLTPELLKQELSNYDDEHRVIPRLVYISNATEIGLIYNKTELKELYEFCQKNKLLLFMDGARLGVALTSNVNDLTLEEVAKYTDAFYIGGAKNGALLGEAVVIKDKRLHDNFRYSMKRAGALLSKGFLLGIQFYALFKDNLYFEIAKTANQKMDYLKEKLTKNKIGFNNTQTNQLFITLDNAVVNGLMNKYLFEVWESTPTNKTIRLITNYNTTNAEIDELILDILTYNIK